MLAPLALPGALNIQHQNSQHPKTIVAIYHLSVKTVSRSAGRSSTAAAAYRAGVEITDERTGEVHDYRRKAGVESAEIFLPDSAPKWATDRAKLWNAAEQAETRKNSTVAREFEIALPAELTPSQRERLAHDFTKAIVQKYGFAADCAIHAPGKDGDSKNHHAHILCTTRKLTAEGFAAKTRELDDRATGAAQVVEVRELFANMTNAALERAGQVARVDHRSLEAQGIDREASIHLGPAATAIERRGETSEKTQHHQERQREAEGKVAAMVAIAEAQAKAAAEQAAAAAAREAEAQREAAARAQAEAQAQAEQLAINTKLAAAAKEKEDDRIRAAALAALAKSSGATDRASAFTVADHAAIDAAIGASKGDLGAAKSNIERAFENTKRNGRGLEGAVQGAERRVARNHLEGCAPAVAKQLGRVDKVLQQASRLFTGVVGSLATAAQTVARQIQKAAAKAPERPTAAAPTQAKAITAPTYQKPPTAVFEPAPVQSTFDPRNASQEAYLARQEAAKLDVNKQAQARGVGAVPFPPGLAGQWAAEHHSSYEAAHAKAVKELSYHRREPRPEGFFKKKEAAAYDAKTAELESKVAGWEKEIGWRGEALKAAAEARKPQDAEYVARAKAEHDRQQAAQAPAQARTGDKDMDEIREQLAQVQADAHRYSYTRSAQISEAKPADYTAHIDAKILASNDKYLAVMKGKDIVIFRAAELEKRLAYTGVDTGRGRFAPGNELEIKKAHKSEEIIAFVREQREEMKTEKQRQRERERGI